MLEQANPDRYLGRRALGRCESPSVRARAGTGGVPAPVLQRPGTDPDHEVEHINKTIRNLKKLISRLIDAYGDGLIEKSEFEPRILAAKQRPAKWEEECRQRMNEATQEAELRLVIGQLEEFASRVSQELQEPSWETRREIILARW